MTARRRAFTLMEVLIALAILSITVVALLGVKTQAIANAAAAAAARTMLLLAQEKMEEIRSSSKLEEEGVFTEGNEGYSWRLAAEKVEVTLKPLEKKETEVVRPASPPKEETQALERVELQRLRLTVIERVTGHSFTLETHRPTSKGS